MKSPKLLFIATLLSLSSALAHADAGPIGSELSFIEGPPDLVQSLRESYAAGRPRKEKKKPAKKIDASAANAAGKAKQRLAQVKSESKEQEKD